MRPRLIAWCYEVVDHFDWRREVVEIAAYYLDRTSALLSDTSSRTYQLLTMASLFLAIKVHGCSSSDKTLRSSRRRLSGKDLAALSRNTFKAEDIHRMESTILFTLRWNVHPPTVARFVGVYFRICPGWNPNPSSARDQSTYKDILNSVYEVACYFAQLAVAGSNIGLHQVEPSKLAYVCTRCAVVFCSATHPIPVQQAWFATIESLLGYKGSGLMEMEQKLGRLVDPREVNQALQLPAGPDPVEREVAVVTPTSMLEGESPKDAMDTGMDDSLASEGKKRSRLNFEQE